jgi:hypothetical protein
VIRTCAKRIIEQLSSERRKIPPGEAGKKIVRPIDEKFWRKHPIEGLAESGFFWLAWKEKSSRRKVIAAR